VKQDFLHKKQFLKILWNEVWIYVDSGNDALSINISSVVEFQRWWVLKKQAFRPRINMPPRKNLWKILRVMTVCQTVSKLYFQSQFWMSKINRIFSKKKLSRRPLFIKFFFSKLNFWTTLLSEITPNFWQTVITHRNFLNIFPWPKTLLFRTHHL